MSQISDVSGDFRSAGTDVHHCRVRIDADLHALSESNHHLATVADVTRAGMSARQWRWRRDAGEWLTVAPGVWRHRATPLDWRLQARAGLMSLGREAALFGRTSAAWWGVGGLEVNDVEFLVPRGRRSIAFPFVLHTTGRWDRRDLAIRDGVRLTTVTRTIVDLAAGSATAAEIERVIDDAISARMTSLPTVRSKLESLGGTGRAGSSLLRALLLDSGGESFLERRFLRLVRLAGLPRPLCQVVHRRDGVRIARVDFQFPGTNVVIEVSGRLGHVSNSDRQHDARRRNDLQATGHVVIEFTTAQVVDQEEYVIATLRHHLPVPVTR